MQFNIEQIAFFPSPGQSELAIEVLSLLGFNRGQEWVRDKVVAHGEVFRVPAASVGHLAFAYQTLDKPLELEVLSYEPNSTNWMRSAYVPAISHLAMHCSAAELDAWHAKMTELGVVIAQSVITDSHTNPAIAGQRFYNYVVYATRALIGVDLKFIVRYNPDMTEYKAPALVRGEAEPELFGGVHFTAHNQIDAFTTALAVESAGDALTEQCHGVALKSGWWGGNGRPDPRDNPLCFPNKLLLVHSEISEACEGDRKGLRDDHLPQYEMRAVELADAAIRIFDMAGAFNIPIGEIIAAKLAYNAQRPDHKPEARAAAGGKAY